MSKEVFESEELRQAIREERARLKAEIPTPDDLPSCTSMLDTFFSCQGIRGSIKSLYRYGELRSCSAKLDDVKFCMGMKWMDHEQRHKAWIKRRAEWWARRRVVEKSSEDVWKQRQTPLENYPIVLEGSIEDLGIIKPVDQ